MIGFDGALRVWQRNFFYFRKTWQVSLFWIVLEPLMYLAAMGYGLGSFVHDINGTSYIEFFFPGLLASTAMLVSFFEGTYANYSKLTYQKLYATIMLAPIQADEIIKGEILWATSKGFLGVLGVTAVASVFGLVNFSYILPVLFIVALTSWVFSSAAMVMISYAKNYDSFIFATSGFIIPMSLISGTYFPLDSLPFALKMFAYLLPLAHSVEAIRMIHAGTIDWMFAVNISYLLILGTILAKWSIRRISVRLYS